MESVQESVKNNKIRKQLIKRMKSLEEDLAIMKDIYSDQSEEKEFIEIIDGIMEEIESLKKLLSKKTMRKSSSSSSSKSKSKKKNKTKKKANFATPCEPDGYCIPPKQCNKKKNICENIKYEEGVERDPERKNPNFRLDNTQAKESRRRANQNFQNLKYGEELEEDDVDVLSLRGKNAYVYIKKINDTKNHKEYKALKVPKTVIKNIPYTYKASLPPELFN